MIDCIFESGTKANLRHVVVTALMVLDNKILLTKRADRLREGGKWSVPGGYLDRDETTVEAIMREVMEETGYTCEVVELFTVHDEPQRPGDDRQNVDFVFTVKPIAKVGEPDDEVTALEWYPLEALPPQSEMAFDHLNLIWEWIQQNQPELLEYRPKQG